MVHERFRRTLLGPAGPSPVSARRPNPPPASPRPPRRPSTRSRPRWTVGDILRAMGALTTVLVLAFVALQASSAAPTQAAAAKAAEVLAADTPRTTVEGNTFIAPAGWRIEVRGPATILSPPEGGSHIALVDVRGEGRRQRRRRRVGRVQPRREVAAEGHERLPGQGRLVEHPQLRLPDVAEREARRRRRRAPRRRACGRSSIYDMEDAVGEKRGAQVALIFSRLLPEGLRARDVRREDAAQARRDAARRALGVRRDAAARSSACPAWRSGSSRTARSCSPTASACASSATPRSRTATRSSSSRRTRRR